MSKSLAILLGIIASAIIAVALIIVAYLFLLEPHPSQFQNPMSTNDLVTYIFVFGLIGVGLVAYVYPVVAVLFAVLGHLGYMRWWTALMVGFAMFAVVGLLGLLGGGRTLNPLLMGAIGAISAGTFWGIWSLRVPEEEPEESEPDLRSPATIAPERESRTSKMSPLLTCSVMLALIQVVMHIHLPPVMLTATFVNDFFMILICGLAFAFLIEPWLVRLRLAKVFIYLVAPSVLLYLLSLVLLRTVARYAILVDSALWPALYGAIFGASYWALRNNAFNLRETSTKG